ncbi:TetR/AcrR family transcriptional regulator [Pseudonocardia sp. CA-107938]|uniref:TetR/AcrR family transcriptional regulator n=1 Tax=Pseudonocardia sp. CA-107938 TaxID=3240021 RepID=UPI003D8D4C8A
MTNVADTPAARPRRQARGERRIGQILEAAAEVFAERGYEAATTNAIAATAGISPGSLYQFFDNKDAIARALAERYADELAAAHDDAFRGKPADLSTAGLVERVLTPLVQFNRRHRAFKTLFARTDMPPTLTEATAPLQAALSDRVVAELARRTPGATPHQLRRAATVAIQVTKALMPLIASAEPDESAWYLSHLQRLLVAHLDLALPRERGR